MELTARVDGNVAFDLDGDQFAEWTGWVAPDDGLLACDLNGNGRIDDVSELSGGRLVLRYNIAYITRAVWRGHQQWAGR